jgi:hypothetical protein
MAIQAYGNNQRFGAYLKKNGGNYKDSYLKKLSVEDLKLELEKQELILSNKTNNGILDTGIKNGLKIGENLVHNTTKYKVKGTTQELYGNEHYLDLVERCKMKYCNVSIKLDPLLETALVIGQTAVMVHGRNSMLENTKTSRDLNEDVPLGIDDEEKYDGNHSTGLNTDKKNPFELNDTN